VIILASDTSTKSLSVAICDDGVKIKSMTKQTGTTHSQTHMPAIIDLLKEVNLDFEDVDLYASTVGPGSYTGIRIGVSTTKAMAYASKKCAIGVSTLETLAFPHQGLTSLVCPILDARNRRVFSSAYFAGLMVITEANRTFDEFLSQILDIVKNDRNVEIVFCGDAASLYRDDLVTNENLKPLIKSGRLQGVVFLETVPEAVDVAVIALRKFNDEKSDKAKKFDPFLLEANYLSPSQAERMKNKRGM